MQVHVIKDTGFVDLNVPDECYEIYRLMDAPSVLSDPLQV